MYHEHIYIPYRNLNLSSKGADLCLLTKSRFFNQKININSGLDSI
ncbi:hypothetical protein EFW57_03478 [Bacillus velezensis]|nr:hypothetical protein EFW57_03478 [Bacillus velezensis]